MKKKPLDFRTDARIVTRRAIKCLDALKQVRGLDDLQIAQQLGCQLSAIDAWRDGSSFIKAKHLHRACAHFKVSLYWICTGRGQMLFGPENKTAQVATS